MGKARFVHAVELTEEAAAAIERLRERTGKTKKAIISSMVEAIAKWDDTTQSLVLDTAPADLVASDAFWEHAEKQLLKGLEACRRKYVERRG